MDRLGRTEVDRSRGRTPQVVLVGTNEDEGEAWKAGVAVGRRVAAGREGVGAGADVGGLPTWVAHPATCAVEEVRVRMMVA